MPEEIQSGGISKGPLASFLEYYLQLDRPRYAVLVRGKWGVGKTFQVKNCVSESERIYVSLFGIATSAELFAAVWAEAFPHRAAASKPFAGLESIIDRLGGPMGALAATPGVLGALLKKRTSNLTASSFLTISNVVRCRPGKCLAR